MLQLSEPPARVQIQCFFPWACLKMCPTPYLYVALGQLVLVEKRRIWSEMNQFQTSALPPMAYLSWGVLGSQGHVASPFSLTALVLGTFLSCFVGESLGFLCLSLSVGPPLELVLSFSYLLSHIFLFFFFIPLSGRFFHLYFPTTLLSFSFPFL